MIFHNNVLDNLIRSHNLTIVYNGDIFRVVTPGNISTIEYNRIVNSFTLTLNQIIANLASLNTLNEDYNIASEYLVRDGYNGNLLGNTGLVNQARLLYSSMLARFNHVSHPLILNYNLRLDLINTLESSLNRLRLLIHETTIYLTSNNIGFHQDKAGSVELSFPNNTSIDVFQATQFLQDRDLVIISLSQRIASLINELNDLETNRLGLNLSQMRVHDFITLAAELERS